MRAVLKALKEQAGKNVANVVYDNMNYALRVDGGDDNVKLITLDQQIKNCLLWKNTVGHIILQHVTISDRLDVDTLKNLFSSYNLAKEFNIKNIILETKDGSLDIGYLYLTNRNDTQKKIDEIETMFPKDQIDVVVV